MEMDGDGKTEPIPRSLIGFRSFLGGNGEKGKRREAERGDSWEIVVLFFLSHSTGLARRPGARWSSLAVGMTVILLHPPLPLVGISTWMERERERQPNDSRANG